MSGKRILSFLAACETRLFGLHRAPAEAGTWLARERHLARIHFAIGLTTSVILGAIGLLVLLALSHARGGLPSVEPRETQLTRAATVPPASVASGPEVQGPAPRSAQRPPDAPIAPAGDTRPAGEIPQRPAGLTGHPPEVSTAPAKAAPTTPAKRPQAAPAPSKSADKPVKPAKQVRNAARVRAPQPPPGDPAPRQPAVPVVAPPPDPVDPVVSSASERPQGLLSLGGPNVKADRPEAEHYWWRKVWWTLPVRGSVSGSVSGGVGSDR